MTDWTGGRSRLADRNAEEARREAYWAWVRNTPGAGDPGGEFVTYVPNAPFWWRHLRTATQADHEARALEHSIGHDWEDYSAMGQIYSLRGKNEEPLATVLVADREIIHVRERRNARPGPETTAAVACLAGAKDLEIRPEPLAFDLGEGDLGPATEITFVKRSGLEKTFETRVFEGQLSWSEAELISGLLQLTPEPTFPAEGITRALRGDIEIVSARLTREEPDDIHIDSLIEQIRASRDLSLPEVSW